MNPIISHNTGRQRPGHAPNPNPVRPAKRRSFLKRHLTRKRLIILGSLLTLFLVLTPLLTYAYYSRDIADRERLMNHNNTGIVLRDRSGEVFYESGSINGQDELTLDQISDDFEKAVIASEDAKFYEHEGYSLRGIAGALYANVLNTDATAYGGSTITQQLVKNRLLSSEKNYLRKYQELSLAIAVERQYTKDEILEMYVNSVYFGEGAFGVKAASQAYFSKDAQNLDIAESALLVGLLPAPSSYSPLSGDPEAAKKQQQRVLDRMVETGAITRQQRDAAVEQSLAYKPTPVQRQQRAHHFASLVLDELQREYGEERTIRSGFDVTTSLDLGMQQAAEEAARQQVARQGRAGARNAGVVAIDPKNGEVRVVVGSVDWNNPTFGKVNMATSPRQPGSSFKPIYYAEALDKRLITPATLLKDQPTTYGGNYRPTNYDFKYRGQVTTRTALALSLNIPAVEVMQKLGVDESARAARDMGLSTVTEPEKYGLSLALGTAEVKLLDMVNAYAAFANNGSQYKPAYYTTIKDKFDNEVSRNTSRRSERVVGREASYLMTSILSDQQTRAPVFGSSLTLPGRQAAAKTGTTNDNRDAWTVGYTPGLVMGVWMGNNENEPMSGVAGSSSAAVVWKAAMTKAHAGLPAESFARPQGVISQQVCASGRAQYEEQFIQGTAPANSCATTAPKDDKKEEKKEEEPKEEEKEESEEQVQPEEPQVPEDEEPVNPTPTPTSPTTPLPTPPATSPAPINGNDR